jgi:hypothetical protein
VTRSIVHSLLVVGQAVLAGSAGAYLTSRQQGRGRDMIQILVQGSGSILAAMGAAGRQVMDDKLRAKVAEVTVAVLCHPLRLWGLLVS